MKSDILLELKKAGDFVSGEKLSSGLGITRSAVWKYINALKEDGCEIISVRNKGYKLIGAPDILNKYEIMNGNTSEVVGKKLILMKSVDSTNEEIKRLALKGEPGGTIVAAENQTAGKGRFGRSWASDGGGLFFSEENGIYQSSPIASTSTELIFKGKYTEREGEKVGVKWRGLRLINRKFCGLMIANRPKNIIFAKKDM